MQSKPLAEQEIGKQLLIETTAYAESSMCRRRTLLHYFGEQYNQDNCNNCDNCLNPKKEVEAKEDLIAVIETVATLKEKFKADHIINVMRGRLTPDIKSYGHNELEVFGCEGGADERLLNAVIRQAIIAGYLDRDIENFGIIHITPEGKKFLKHPQSFKIVEDNEFNEDEEIVEVKGGASCAVDPELYNILKDLRKKVAKKFDVPPYVIFQDFSLEAMATTYPITMEEMQNIAGVGVGKAKRYGEEFIKVIHQHVIDNEIERPEDMRVRGMANKSKQKIAIIQAIDRRVPLDEIAEIHGLEFNELLDEIEAIMYSGSKINISYYIDEVIDPDVQSEIFDYFKQTESDDINKAYEELGEDYTELEIRLMRIKFLSELGY